MAANFPQVEQELAAIARRLDAVETRLALWEQAMTDGAKKDEENKTPQTPPVIVNV